MEVCEFDYLEMQYIKDALELSILAVRQNQKENEPYMDIRFKQIGEAKIETINKMIKKLEEENNKYYPTKLMS